MRTPLIYNIFFGLLVSWGSLIAQPQSPWVDSVLATLSVEDKIAQMMLLRAPANDDFRGILKQLQHQPFGGVVFTKSSPVSQAKFVNEINRITTVPFFVGFQSTDGLNFSIDSTVHFPDPVMLGAIRNDSLITALGRLTGRQLKLLGVNLVLAPSVRLGGSISKSPSAFGDNTENVIAKATAFTQGLAHEGILSSISFLPSAVQPGPELLNNYNRLIDAPVAGLMSGPSSLPELYVEKKRKKKNSSVPAQPLPVYSGTWIKNTLRTGDKLIFADIASQSDQNLADGDAELYSFLTGNEVIVSPADPDAAIRKIRKAIKDNPKLELQLNAAVKKILTAKYNAGLTNGNTLITDNLIRKLNSPEVNVLNRTLLENAVTVVRNENNLVPVQQLANQSFAAMLVGTHSNTFAQYLNKYTNVDVFRLHEAEIPIAAGDINEYNTIIIGLFTPFDSLTPALKKFLLDIPSNKVVVSDFTFLGNDQLYRNGSTIIQAYTSTDAMQEVVPQVIFGAIEASGKLPVTLNNLARTGDGVNTRNLKRFGFALPEAVGFSSKVLDDIEMLAMEAIDSMGTPGCHILIARHGKIIYDRNFGWLTYDRTSQVTDSTIYDLASVTKVAATLQAFMFLFERGYFDLDKKVSAYLPELKGTNKEDILLIDVLTHQAGLQAFLPFWERTMKDTLLLPEYYRHEPSEAFSLQVAKNLFIKTSMRDSLWSWMVKSELRTRKDRVPHDYLYSDFSFYILYRLCEKYLNQAPEEFLAQNLYEPLGAVTMGYLPLRRFPESRIAPTENDLTFRKSLLVGTVHDQGTALMGGVAGHAGLFSNAIDLAKLGQMLLQRGYYGGTRYYRPETVDFFNTPPFENNHRGLGWNKPVPSNWVTATSIYASYATFGHTGFTGTSLWIDPEFDLVFVFLSNRVHPDMDNRKLIDLNIRTRIQDLVYQSIFEFCKESGFSTTYE